MNSPSLDELITWEAGAGVGDFAFVGDDDENLTNISATLNQNKH